MPSIITFAQIEPLEDFCSSLMLVAAESYIGRAMPIADIDSQGATADVHGQPAGEDGRG